MKRIDKIRTKLTKVVEKALDRKSIDEISIDEQDNQTGEPSIYVSITMKTVDDIPDVRRQGALTHNLVLALEDMEDARFPYLFIGATDDEMVDDEEEDDEVEFEDLEPPPRQAGRR